MLQLKPLLKTLFKFRFARPFAKVALLLCLLCAFSSIAHADLPWLRAEGTNIVNERGETVILSGINLGGWLIEEMWMTPFVTKPPAGMNANEVKDSVTLWQAFEKRVGIEETQKLKTAWRENWLTEADFKRIRDAGFNHVRLPFIYDLQAEPQGLFFWLDRALAWAKKYDLYVVLDLHGAPGRQSDGHITGQAGVNKFFFDLAMVEATEKLWVQIATRYKDRPEVAGYNLLNEPMGAPNNSTLYMVQDRLYRAIRAVDARHLIIIEDGYKGYDQMPYPAVCGWKNVALSIHSYDFNAKTPADHERQLGGMISSVRKAQIARNAPFYLGEFNIEPHATPEGLTSFVRGVRRQGWSWALWTYKVAGPPGGRSFWGWFYSENGLVPVNPFADTPAETIRKFAAFRTENMKAFGELKTALTKMPLEALVTQWQWKSATAGETAPGAGEWKPAAIGADLFGGKSGVAWLRATLPHVPGPHRTLHFSPVDDKGTIFLNGKKLQSNEGWNQPFSVPLDGAWRENGPNEVWVLVENTNQSGGLTGDVGLSSEP